MTRIVLHLTALPVNPTASEIAIERYVDIFDGGEEEIHIALRRCALSGCRRLIPPSHSSRRYCGPKHRHERSNQKKKEAH